MIIVVGLWNILFVVPLLTAIAAALTGLAVIAVSALRNNDPQPFTSSSVPQSTEGVPVPLVWGRQRIRNPNTLWFGNQASAEAPGGPRDAPVRDYTITFALGLCLISPAGGAARLFRVWAGERVISGLGGGGTTATDAGAIINVDAQSAFGGRRNGGGMLGTITFYGTVDTASVNPGIQVQLPDNNAELVAYRSQAWMIWIGVVGESPQVRPLSAEVEVIPNGLGVGAVGSDGDANPAEVLWDLLTSGWGRLELPTSQVNQTSFTAAATTLNTESHGISLQVSQEVRVQTVIDQILSQIDGLLFEEPTTGELTLKLLRDDFVVGDLPLFDTSNVINLEDWSASFSSDSYNQVRVTYTSRVRNYTLSTVTVQDQANIDTTGDVRTLDLRFPGVSNATLAEAIATRELGLVTLPLARARMIANRDAATLRPGDAIRLAWSPFGIAQIVMRVVSVSLGTLDNGQVSVELVQDRFAFGATIFEPQPPVIIPSTPAPADVVTEAIQEAPRWFNIRAQDLGIVTSHDPQRLVYPAVQPNSDTVGFSSEVAVDSTTDYGQDRLDMGFTLTTTTELEYTIATDEYDTTTGIRLVADSFDIGVIASATRAQIEQEGRNLILINDEILSYEGFVVLANDQVQLTSVWRGLLDTSARTHPAGSRVYFIGAAFPNIMGALPFATLPITTLRSRLLTTNGIDRLSPLDATVKQITFQNRVSRSLPVANLTFDGVAHPVSVSGQVSLVWNNRSRFSTEIARPDAATETIPTTDFIIRESTDLGMNYTETIINTGTTTSATHNFANSPTLLVEFVTRFENDDSTRNLWPVTRTFQSLPP